MDHNRREELKKSYKETKQQAGVYQIKNLINGKIFVGANPNVNARINRHRAEFVFGGGNNHGLSEDVKIFGKDNFSIEVLETLNGEYDSSDEILEDLKILESIWLEKLDPYGDKGYNIRETVQGGK